jgi:DNA (cytosine-5)-methyltransferase 1
LIDWFCRAGGASMGYHRAGFDVIGVDKIPVKSYPFRFVQADALALFADPPAWVLNADAHTGSPPCQAHTLCQRIQGNGHPDLIPPTREAFQRFGKPWIIENVEGAPLRNPVMLCGAMFPGLRVYRHRLFESSIPLGVPEHPEHVAPLRKMGRKPEPGDFMHVVGNFSGVAVAREAMGIEWMTRDDLREAIPPAYTEHLGVQLMDRVSELADDREARRTGGTFALHYLGEQVAA